MAYRHLIPRTGRSITTAPVISDPDHQYGCDNSSGKCTSIADNLDILLQMLELQSIIKRIAETMCTVKQREGDKSKYKYSGKRVTNQLQKTLKVRD